MYRVLITGSTGFLGGHLMKYLGSLGYEVDTLSKKEFMNEDFRRLDNFGLVDQEFPKDNVPTAEQIEKRWNVGLPIEAIVRPDIVVHCAWPKLDLQVTDHLEFAEMTCNFYNECKKRGIRVINIGSSSEYGVKFEPMKEDMICEPINTYGIAKLAVTLYAKKLGFNTLRLFAVYGKGGHGFHDNCEKYDKWEWPTSNRCLINVKYVTKAIERLMYAEHLYGEIINVGDGSSWTYCDMVQEQQVGDLDDERWGLSPQNQYEAFKWEADISKMDRLLNI